MSGRTAWTTDPRRWPLPVAATLVAALTLVPLGFVAAYGVVIGPGEAAALLLRPRVAELLGNTGRLVASAMLLCAAVGTAAAWLVERTGLRGRRAWTAVLAAPLAVPAFVNGFGWVSLSGRVQGFWGALLVVTLSYYPLVFLPVLAALRGLDPGLEETAAALGLRRRAVAARVVLPQLVPALLGGSLLVGLHLLGEFGAIQLLRYDTFTTAIYDQYTSTFNGPAANMLAGILVLCCLVLLVGELALRGRRSYARVGGGAPRVRARRRLRLRYAAVAHLGLGLLAALALGVPMAALVRWLVVGTSTAFPAGPLAAAAGASIGLGLLGAAVTTLLALPVAWLAVRRRARWSTALERSTYVANALPGIVVALALVTVSLWAVPAAYQTLGLLLAAYAIMFLPRSVVSIEAALAQAPRALEDVAEALGVGAMRRFVRVVLPLIAPGVGAGAALVFLAVTTELTATLLLAPIGTDTLATRFWSASGSLAYGAAAPYAALIVLVSLPATWLLTRDPGRR